MEDYITQSRLTLKQRYQWQNLISRKSEQDDFTKLILWIFLSDLLNSLFPGIAVAP